MDFRTTQSSFAEAFAGGLSGSARPEPHIIDQLIEERATRMSKTMLWPLLRPLLYRAFEYRRAVFLADEIAPLSGYDAMAHLSALLYLDIDITGLSNIPSSGGFILAPSHPTGIADGIAAFDVLKNVRPDMAIFANRDAERVAPGFRDLIIPVEWRQDEKTHAKSRDTLEMTARAFMQKRAVVLFPSGRIAYWHEGRLTERPWQTSVISLARRYGFPIVPMRMTARNSGLFYLLSRYSTELRDMTIFRELLNKKGGSYSVVIGRPIPPADLEGESRQVIARLQEHTVFGLAADPEAVFERRKEASALSLS
ncbi:MAG: acyltransferase [Rhizobiales bacterium 65-79]|jgi:putative hemolysin|nr:1-acyl-sn-glycerol-3-phosphate acyltransferase [Hyphomicrobiales bacterium]OJU01033.1 MAG: acyltransferase [Rhizobiales bacterium 65-79]